MIYPSISKEFIITDKDINDYKDKVKDNKIQLIWNQILNNLPEDLKSEAKVKTLKIDFDFKFDKNNNEIPLVFRIVYPSKRLKLALSEFRLYWKQK